VISAEVTLSVAKSGLWNPGLVCTDKVDFVCGMCICSSSYKTVVVEIGLKGRGFVIVHAHSLDHVLIL